jgi:hypothetical protein
MTKDIRTLVVVTQQHGALAESGTGSLDTRLSLLVGQGVERIE